ncbi:unnamed protein product [Ostreobium quekettii]|uniref:Protein kinase domain-containing protein n=1 Tax=Ostreobium quekettii TaxID=121088 RepID=A0A8S1IU86_9CHLO|nr:unnamed protein product [Ostreobium quekettii]|eukprot:evm.model.scf_210.2 EVM.evm.TU.scf_210.2   scf_210:44942-50285(+)
MFRPDDVASLAARFQTTGDPWRASFEAVRAAVERTGGSFGCLAVIAEGGGSFAAVSAEGVGSDRGLLLQCGEVGDPGRLEAAVREWVPGRMAEAGMGNFGELDAAGGLRSWPLVWGGRPRGLLVIWPPVGGQLGAGADAWVSVILSLYSLRIVDGQLPRCARALVGIGKAGGLREAARRWLEFLIREFRLRAAGLGLVSGRGGVAAIIALREDGGRMDLSFGEASVRVQAGTHVAALRSGSGSVYVPDCLAAPPAAGEARALGLETGEMGCLLVVPLTSDRPSRVRPQAWSTGGAPGADPGDAYRSAGAGVACEVGAGRRTPANAVCGSSRELLGFPPAAGRGGKGCEYVAGRWPPLRKCSSMGSLLWQSIGPGGGQPEHGIGTGRGSPGSCQIQDDGQGGERAGPEGGGPTPGAGRPVLGKFAKRSGSDLRDLLRERGADGKVGRAALPSRDVARGFRVPVLLDKTQETRQDGKEIGLGQNKSVAANSGTRAHSAWLPGPGVAGVPALTGCGSMHRGLEFWCEACRGQEYCQKDEVLSLKDPVSGRNTGLAGAPCLQGSVSDCGDSTSSMGQCQSLEEESVVAMHSNDSLPFQCNATVDGDSTQLDGFHIFYRREATGTPHGYCGERNKLTQSCVSKAHSADNLSLSDFGAARGKAVNHEAVIVGTEGRLETQCASSSGAGPKPCTGARPLEDDRLPVSMSPSMLQLQSSEDLANTPVPLTPSGQSMQDKECGPSPSFTTSRYTHQPQCNSGGGRWALAGPPVQRSVSDLKGILPCRSQGNGWTPGIVPMRRSASSIKDFSAIGEQVCRLKREILKGTSSNKGTPCLCQGADQRGSFCTDATAQGNEQSDRGGSAALVSNSETGCEGLKVLNVGIGEAGSAGVQELRAGSAATRPIVHGKEPSSVHKLQEGTHAGSSCDSSLHRCSLDLSVERQQLPVGQAVGFWPGSSTGHKHAEVPTWAPAHKPGHGKCTQRSASDIKLVFSGSASGNTWTGARGRMPQRSASDLQVFASASGKMGLKRPSKLQSPVELPGQAESFPGPGLARTHDALSMPYAAEMALDGLQKRHQVRCSPAENPPGISSTSMPKVDDFVQLPWVPGPAQVRQGCPSHTSKASRSTSPCSAKGGAFSGVSGTQESRSSGSGMSGHDGAHFRPRGCHEAVEVRLKGPPSCPMPGQSGLQPGVELGLGDEAPSLYGVVYLVAPTRQAFDESSYREQVEGVIGLLGHKVYTRLRGDLEEDLETLLGKAVRQQKLATAQQVGAQLVGAPLPNVEDIKKKIQAKKCNTRKGSNLQSLPRSLQLLSVLGEGSSGLVLESMWHTTKTAVKVFVHSRGVGHMDLNVVVAAEVSLATIVSHPNVVRTLVSFPNAEYEELLGACGTDPGPRSRQPALNGEADDTYLGWLVKKLKLFHQFLPHYLWGPYTSGPAPAAVGGGGAGRSLEGGNWLARVLKAKWPHYNLVGTKWAVLVMEYCSLGTLERAIRDGKFRKGGSANMEWILLTALEIAQAMDHLQKEHGIVHGDLKPLNILLSSAAKDGRHFTAKVADFGTSRIVTGGVDELRPMQMGTCAYMPPEILSYTCGQSRRCPISFAMDVYSFGVLLWEMYCGQKPYGSKVSAIVIRQQVIQNGLRPVFLEGTPIWFKQLVKRCWHQQAEQRPSFEDVRFELETLLKKTRNSGR